MNRKDREITDIAEILSILDRCDTIRLGLTNGGRSYVVPVSFGMAATDGKPTIYFHGSKRGLKVDCMNADSRACVEADIFYKVEPFRSGFTARFESVVGFGSVQEVSGEEKTLGLKKICEHYGYFDTSPETCGGFAHTGVYKIVLDEITGKRNLPETTDR